MKFKSALKWIKIISVWFHIKTYHKQLHLIVAVTNLLDLMKKKVEVIDENWEYFVGTEVRVSGDTYGYIVLYGYPAEVKKFMLKGGLTFEANGLEGKLVVVNHHGELRVHPEKDILGKRWISKIEVIP